jgi:hypothetical protein
VGHWVKALNSHRAPLESTYLARYAAKLFDIRGPLVCTSCSQHAYRFTDECSHNSRYVCPGAPSGDSTSYEYPSLSPYKCNYALRPNIFLRLHCRPNSNTYGLYSVWLQAVADSLHRVRMFVRFSVICWLSQDDIHFISVHLFSHSIFRTKRNVNPHEMRMQNAGRRTGSKTQNVGRGTETSDQGVYRNPME